MKTIREVAKELGMSYATASQVERGALRKIGDMLTGDGSVVEKRRATRHPVAHQCITDKSTISLLETGNFRLNILGGHQRIEFTQAMALELCNWILDHIKEPNE